MKKAIAAGVILSALAGLYPACKSDSTPRDSRSASELEQMIADFPSEIAGAERVDTYMTPGAKYCLVHIRQRHLVNDISDERRDRVRQTQANIYSILQDLHNKVGIDAVYVEGVSPWNISELTQQPDHYNAGLKFSAKKGIEVLPGEDTDLYRLSGFAEEYISDNPHLIHFVIDEREDHLLREISKQDSPMNYVIFGGAHAWGGTNSFGEEYNSEGRLSAVDNIHVWNTLNPDRKFSLIEITPKDM